ncbi:TetR/AcrR family transcriptional regulator [Polaromonas glacialis]|uniref:TetR/AcrR family transcriptional regulator n=1 Tax=Polaromonas glacialis TaxID=866564 RepID=UPI00068E242F|nr:TetR/AcrR family transcriptional regulator [Polaromonas glacialis]
MSERSTYHHGNLRDTLVAYGKQLLLTQGPLNISLRSVTRAAGVSPAAPRHEFGDLNGLLSAIAVEGFDELIALRSAAVAQAADPVQRLRAVLQVYVDFAIEKPGLFWLMIGPQISDRHERPEINQATERSYALLQRYVYEYLQSQDLGAACTHELVQCAWSAMHGVSMLFSGRSHGPNPAASLPFEVWRESVIDFTLVGLVARGKEISAKKLADHSQSHLP